MTRVDFYHLQQSSLEQALPKLLEKAYKTEKNVLVKVGTEPRVEFLNTALWTYDEQSFLPHGTKKDGNANMQPIWLTDGEDNPNQSKLLFLVDGAMIDSENIEQFERIFNIFDGADEDSLTKARAFWKEIKAKGFECYYWQQENGNWKQKA